VTTYAHRWHDEALFTVQGRDALRGRIKDVISYCVCDWEEPGIRVGKRALDCSPEEIYEELCFAHEADGTVLPGFDRADHIHPIDAKGKAVPCLVDEALVYDKRGKRIVRNEDSLVHVPPGYFDRLPDAKTEIANFAIAGCHVKHGFGCGDSMEGANETGRRAANAVLERAGQKRRVPILEGRSDSKAVKLLELARSIDAKAFSRFR
jgi:15-cis-phytoene desaturase